MTDKKIDDIKKYFYAMQEAAESIALLENAIQKTTDATRMLRSSLKTMTGILEKDYNSDLDSGGHPTNEKEKEQTEEKKTIKKETS